MRDALNTDDADKIKSATEELNTAMQQADAGTRGPGFDGASENGSASETPREAEEGTVEGEFREV